AIAQFDNTNLTLPSPWKLGGTIPASVFGGPQGFVAAGALPSAGGALSAIAVVGFPWADFAELYFSSMHSLAPSPVGAVTTDFGFNLFYSRLRTLLWQQLLFARQSVP